MLLYGMIRGLALAGLVLVVLAAVFDAPGAVMVADALFWLLEHTIRLTAALGGLLADLHT
jgi:hypothetical protein